MSDTTDVTLRLQRGQEGLDDLLDGVFACAVWLVKNGDGTYSLRCGGVCTEDDGSEAYLRILLERSKSGPLTEPGEEPPWPPVVQREPTEKVATFMEQLKIRLGWNGAPAE